MSKAKYWCETDSKQVPQGKDEKDFEKRVKECLKLSRGKQMGARDASRIAGARVGWRDCFIEPCHGIKSSKWAIFGKQNWRCGINGKLGYGAKLCANLEPKKGVGRLRQQDDGHGSQNPLRRVCGGCCKTLGVSLGGTTIGADLGGSSKYSNENFKGRRGESLPTLEMTQSEVGSSGWKSTACRAVFGAPQAALENMEDRVHPTPGRTHNRIRSLVNGTM
ncbi:hypothetical protein Tco_0720595 [Tanacetum coccineum]